jgi:signal transduction histidine kinase
MRFRTWPVAAAALGGLLLLVVLSVLTASQKAQDISTELDEVIQQYHLVESKLRGLRSDVNLSGIFVRDYLLDTARERAPEYRQRLSDFRQKNLRTFEELRDLALERGENPLRFVRLEAQLEEYWEALDPLFDWTMAEKLSFSAGFLRREVLPRREAILTIAREIEELNRATMAAQRSEITARQAAFRDDLFNLVWRSLLLGAVVAITAVIRLRVLERRADEQRFIAREAEEQMRLLSQQIVATQEEERKKLSRELHDHVGQMLTALRMELGRIDRLRSGDARLDSAVAECRQLVDNMVRTVRDLALGLRPSMLDDLGLHPALEWHVRDFTRRYGIPVELEISGDLANLQEPHRTCVYRVVQEALTNCARHAHATRATVRVDGEDEQLEVAVTDNGVGLAPERRRAGLGLRGIEERVRDLRGTMHLQTGAHGGTALTIRLPVAPPPQEQEVALARVAG